MYLAVAGEELGTAKQREDLVVPFLHHENLASQQQRHMYVCGQHDNTNIGTCWCPTYNSLAASGQIQPYHTHNSPYPETLPNRTTTAHPQILAQILEFQVSTRCPSCPSLVLLLEMGSRNVAKLQRQATNSDA